MFAFLSVAGGCAGGGSGVGCPTPNRCTASPIGSWTQIDCEPWDHLSHVDLVNGTAVRSCTLALDHEGIIASGDLAIAAGGRYTRTWVETGAWSGLVAAAGCLDAPGASCATLTAFDGWGATGCAETAEGCRCEGTLDRSGQESGDWQTGSGALVLEADAGGRETSTLCAGDTFMSLDPTGAEIARTYRRQTPTPAQ
ncbi:MAG: hypothetical protein CVU56_10870 [Deltaproteobacteria bacterium HGW-Deltaproteobacteria-14]|nr:MAG: hypothetical protein CVU56_10870 [Deltaproteobacteria bacterium HGW-Deltaproteobacteria-14]